MIRYVPVDERQEVWAIFDALWGVTSPEAGERRETAPREAPGATILVPDDPRPQGKYRRWRKP